MRGDAAFELALIGSIVILRCLRSERHPQACAFPEKSRDSRPGLVKNREDLPAGLSHHRPRTAITSDFFSAGSTVAVSGTAKSHRDMMRSFIRLGDHSCFTRSRNRILALATRSTSTAGFFVGLGIDDLPARFLKHSNKRF